MVVDRIAPPCTHELTEVMLGEEATEYLRAYLGDKGDTLSQLALNQNFRAGVIFAYLPADLAAPDRVTRFDRGVLEDPELVDRAKVRAAMFVSGFLNAAPNRVAFFETYFSADAMAQMRNDLPFFVYRPTRYGSWDGTVGVQNESGACLYMKSDELKNFSAESLTCGSGRPDIGFLSSPAPATLKLLENGKEQLGSTLHDLAAGVRHIVVPGYDGETYLIWSRVGLHG
jgi:hypothetical protein